MRLRTKLVAVLVVLALVLGASLYGGLELYKQQTVEREHDRAEETATVVAAQIDATIQERRDFVGFAASRPDAASFDRADRFTREFVDDSRFFAAQIVAANGTVVAFNGDVTEESRERTIGSVVGDEPYVREALAGRIYVSDPEYAPTERHVAIISAPITEEGEVIGVLAAAVYVDTSTLLTPLQPIPSERRSVAVLAGNETLYRAGPAFERTLSGEARVESTGWTVRITHDRAELDTLLHDVRVAEAVGLFLVLGIVSVGGGWQYRTTVAQMNRLQCAFDAARRGDYGYDFSLSGGDEWRDIANGFDDLLCELSERERVLERRRQRLDVLNRVLRHNLRNDLGVVLGYADMIRKGDASDPQNLAEIIHRRASTLIELGKTARETQRLMADVTDPEPVDVGRVLLDTVDDLSTEFPAVRFETDVPIPAYASAISGIDAALRNVCENACEYNDARTPCVDVSLTRLDDDDRLRITIADNGPGIPSYEVAVLQRGHETALDHGSGLGLWLVQWVVDGSGGHLSVEQTEPRGTAVTIELDATPSPYDRSDR